MVTSPTTRFIDPDLPRRVCAEFCEMPGLRLTLLQASRLWNTDVRVTADVLDELVEVGFLRHVGPYYFRSDLGVSEGAT